MSKWQVIKDHIPIILCDTIEKAEEEYLKYDADEIRRIPDKDEEERN